jgi:aminoglycoside 3-N-acetyltransferase
MTDPARPFRTRDSLRGDLRRLGVRTGDLVMVHAAMSRVGRLLNGPDAFIGALLDAVGSDGTILAYTDWDGAYDELLDDRGRVPPEWREHVPPYDPKSSRANRDNGVLAEFIRTTADAKRSGNPGASVVAIGALAEWITSDHPLDYGYGEGSPFAKLVAGRGRVLLAGAPLDTMTLLHHSEDRALLPGKRVRRYEVPFSAADGVRWRVTEEFDTSIPVVPGLADDYFATIVDDFLARGHGARGQIGGASSVLVDAAAICAFAIVWLEERIAGHRVPGRLP